jgi:hypothetical protein
MKKHMPLNGTWILSISNEMEGIHLVVFRGYFCPNEKKSLKIIKLSPKSNKMDPIREDLSPS